VLAEIKDNFKAGTLQYAPIIKFFKYTKE